MSEAEAEAGAAAEGLELLRSERNSTGYQFVFNCSKPGKPFQAKLNDSTGQEHLGYFGSAHEAALADMQAAHDAAERLARTDLPCRPSIA